MSNVLNLVLHNTGYLLVQYWYDFGNEVTSFVFVAVKLLSASHHTDIEILHADVYFGKHSVIPVYIYIHIYIFTLISLLNMNIFAYMNDLGAAIARGGQGGDCFRGRRSCFGRLLHRNGLREDRMRRGQHHGEHWRGASEVRVRGAVR